MKKTDNYITNKMRVISLFSGAGGLDVGFEQAGFHTVFANEFDHDAAEAWRINRPETAHVMVEGDINEHLRDLAAFHDIDVIIGGPPCQGFSVAGKMDPNDERSQLVWRFMDAVEIVRPKAFVMENVAALGVLEKWDGVRKGILAKGKALGYNVSFKVHHTPDYGVPENRDRVIFIGVREDIGDIDLDGIVPTLPASMGGNKTPIVDEVALYDASIPNWFATYHAGLVAGTTTPAESTIPKTVRRLTLKECAAIQTFPVGYKFSGRKTKQYKQIGNAVPCHFAEAVASAVRDAYLKEE